MAQEKLEDVSDFVTKVGFPGAVSLVLIGLAVWLIYHQITTTDGLIRSDTEAKIEMTSAIRALETSSTRLGTNLNSLEMETTRRLDRMEIHAGKAK